VGTLAITAGLTSALAYLGILVVLPVEDVVLRQFFAVALVVTLAPTVIAIVATASRAVRKDDWLHRLSVYATAATFTGVAAFFTGDLYAGVTMDVAGAVARAACAERKFAALKEIDAKFDSAYQVDMSCYDEKRADALAFQIAARKLPMPKDIADQWKKNFAQKCEWQHAEFMRLRKEFQAKAALVKDCDAAHDS
jgi:hypothetical protein